ncbi:MAG TPA: NeuD/PglB/VioB family sugar acetyltransferase [Burkholderiaceae bacterium]|nr:NeuD/PglB/VioB family sugar acetyltransferase [Burkholderiaceae bacterium]
MEPLLIFPYNGNGIEALDCLSDAFRCMAFIDDSSDRHGTDALGNLVMGREALTHWPDAQILAVPGSPASYLDRADAIRSLGVPPSRFAQVIHPTARISPLATVGRNVLIMAGVVVTSNATIEDHTCILPNTVVHHDVVIGEFSLIGSHVTLAGGVHIGRNCYIGSGSTLKNGIQVGERALIGLGSTVIRDVDADRRVAGNPARELRLPTR